MKLAAPVYAAVKLAGEQGIPTGKTVLQKLLFFSLPPQNRQEYYEPYYYGPYSKTVQMIADQLQEKGFVRYNPVNSAFEVAKQVELGTLQNAKPLIERLQAVIAFLKENSITSTAQIALLSKVFLFDSGEDINAALIHAIQEKSRLFNWREVTDAEGEVIGRQVCFARELKTRLEKTAA